MKYKRELMGSMLAFSLFMGINSSFAEEMNASSTKMHLVRDQLHMKSRNGTSTIEKLEHMKNGTTTSTSTTKMHKKMKRWNKTGKERATSTTPKI